MPRVLGKPLILHPVDQDDLILEAAKLRRDNFDEAVPGDVTVQEHQSSGRDESQLRAVFLESAGKVETEPDVFAAGRALHPKLINRTTRHPLIGRLVYYLLPLRRKVVLGNLRRVFAESISEDEIRRLAQAYYAHYARFISDFVRQIFMSAERRQTWIRVENMESPLRVHNAGKGILLLTGHFGNWEVSTVAGIQKFPEYKNLFYFGGAKLSNK